MKRKTMIRYLFVFMTLILITGCIDVIEEDISSDEINILAPAGGAVLAGPGVLFWWDLLPGADSYELQVVKPDFSAPAELVADTVITGGTVTISLAAGPYEWRVRACNSAYCTEYFYNTLTVSAK